MNAEVLGRQWFKRILKDYHPAEVGVAPAWVHDIQIEAVELVDNLSLPDRKQENWRYTDFENLYSRAFYRQSTPVTGVAPDDVDIWIYPDTQSYRLVFVNGSFVPDLSTINQLQGPIAIGSLRVALATGDKGIMQALSGQLEGESDVFSALNYSMLNDGLFVHINENVKVEKPVEVVYLNVNFEQNVISQPFSLVVLDSDAELKLIEHHISTADSEYFVNGNNRIVIGERAKLAHTCLQHESPSACHLNRFKIFQNGGSDYRAFYIATGARWSRAEIDLELIGDKANCELKGIFTSGSSQYNDIHMDVRHAKPQCRSRVDYRGIVHGRGRAVFDGRIAVERDAQKSDALLSNKNLMLSESAEIDTKPQLEIYADDVKCGHGTTVGRIDPNQIFYMRSRGIPHALALRMLCIGFAEQVMTEINDEQLHDFILSEIAEAVQHDEEVLT